MLFQELINKLSVQMNRKYISLEANSSLKNVSLYFLFFILVRLLTAISLVVGYLRNVYISVMQNSKNVFLTVMQNSRNTFLSGMQMIIKALYHFQIRRKEVYLMSKQRLIEIAEILWQKASGLKDEYKSKAISAIKTSYMGKYKKKTMLLDDEEPVEPIAYEKKSTKNEDLQTIVQIPEMNVIKEQNHTFVVKLEGEKTGLPLRESRQRTNPFYFCTMTGKEYILKVLALHQSLQKCTDKFFIWICCIDQISYSILTTMKLSNVCIFKLDRIEDGELLAIKRDRKTNEYCWTLKAPLIRYVLENYKIEDVIYCDADLYFFSTPRQLYDEWGNYDVFLCPQRDIGWVESKFGKYQAGLMGFKNNPNSMECLNYWRNKCIEWCFSNPEPEMERFGDQKYLDKLPVLFQGVKTIENLGVDAAPWNCIYNNNFTIIEKDGQIYIEKDKLVVFHFATIVIYNESEFDLWKFNYIQINKIIMNKIYLPYLTVIRECAKRIGAIDAGLLSSIFSANPSSEAKTYYKYPSLKFMLNTDDDTKYFCTIMSREYLMKGLAFYNSLRMHAGKFHLWVCCADETSRRILTGMQLKDVTLVNVADIEDNKIKKVKNTRKLNEFCWTLKAPLVQYIISNYDIESIIYCDADIFFFSNPEPVYESWKGHSIFVCRQRDTYEFEKVHGGFQAGFIGFRNDRESRRILAWWREKCIDWCFDDPQPQLERWGDQKYLDRLPMLFSGIKLDDNKGINAAPWNIVFNNNFNVTKVNENVYIDNDKLIFYHFGSMLFFNENEFDLWKLKPLTFKANILNNIYLPYLKTVKAIIIKVMPHIYCDIKRLFTDKASTSAVNYFNIKGYTMKL